MMRLLFFVLLLSALTVQAQQSRVKLDLVEPDKTTVFLPCAPGWPTPEGPCRGSLEVNVKVRLTGADSNAAKVSSIVTGGRVASSGNDGFRWDLSGVPPGTYTATVMAEDRDGRAGETKTFPIKVERCPNCQRGDSCATVKLNAPEGLVQPGESFKVEAAVSGRPENATYNWTVSAGTIEAGQGTLAVTVGTAGLPGGTSVTVSLEMNVPAGFHCQTNFSEVIPLADLPKPVLIDEFPTTVPCEDGNARLDYFFAELNNNPGNRGVIVIYDSPQHRRAAWRREQLFRNFIKFRRYDTSELTVIRGPHRQEAKTQFWRVPPGSSDPDVLDANATAPLAKPEPAGPYLYATEHMDALPECDVPRYDLEAYAEELNAEPRSRGRIVIGEPSRAKFLRKQREVSAKLARHGVAKTRLAFVYKYVRPNRLLEMTELWVVPKRNTK